MGISKRSFESSLDFGEKRSATKNRISDAQKISRATSVNNNNEPALELIQKTVFDERTT